MNATGPFRVLLVTSEKKTADLVSSALEKEEGTGFAVYRADAARAALETLGRTDIDLVICSARLPEMSGEELCREIKRDHRSKDAYFILLTKRARPPGTMPGGVAAPDDYVREPLRLDELAARVRIAVRIKGLEQERRAHAGSPSGPDTDTNTSTVRALIHDINNPLSVILTEIEVFRRTCPAVSDETMQCLEHIRVYALRIKDILNRVSPTREAT